MPRRYAPEFYEQRFISEAEAQELVAFKARDCFEISLRLRWDCSGIALGSLLIARQERVAFKPSPPPSPLPRTPLSSPSLGLPSITLPRSLLSLPQPPLPHPPSASPPPPSQERGTWAGYISLPPHPDPNTVVGVMLLKPGGTLLGPQNGVPPGWTAHLLADAAAEGSGRTSKERRVKRKKASVVAATPRPPSHSQLMTPPPLPSHAQLSAASPAFSFTGELRAATWCSGRLPPGG